MIRVRHVIGYVAFAALAILAVGCGGSPTDPSQNVNVPYSQTDITVGTGRVAANGNRVTAHYTLWLYNGSSAENKGSLVQTSVGAAPIAFTLGAGQVIQGFDRGVTGMAVGGKRRLVLPPDLAYGSQGSAGGVPPNATIIFEVELVNVE